MTPYYRDDFTTLYHGEAFDVMTQLDATVDAVITDPPYSSGGFTRGDRTQSTTSKYQQSSNIKQWSTFTGDNRDARSWAFWVSMWTQRAMAMTRESGYLLCFTDWRMLPTLTDAIQSGGWIWRGLIAWDKTEGARAPHTGYFRHQCEYIAWGTNGVSAAADHGGPWPGYYRVPIRHTEKHHMTGKPTELMRGLCKVVPAGALILDPFAGSGTTLLAAKQSGRHAIGIEMQENNCEITAKRLQEEIALDIKQEPAKE